MNPDSQPLTETTCRNCGNPIIGQRNNYSFGTYDNWWHTTEKIGCKQIADGWKAMERIGLRYHSIAEPKNGNIHA